MDLKRALKEAIIGIIKENDMNPEKYVKEALRTEPTEHYGRVLYRLHGDVNLRLLHASLGLTTEAAEIADIIKKHLMYGKTMDGFHHLIEECGDLLWYMAIICDVTGVSLEEIMRKNIEKLAKRFPREFLERDAMRQADKYHE